jgi:hypothetical protein
MHSHGIPVTTRPRRRSLRDALILFGATLALSLPLSEPPQATAVDSLGDDTVDGVLYGPKEAYDLLGPQTAEAGDPLGLLLYPEETRRYTLGHDVYEVWSCPDSGSVPYTASAFAAEAETRMTAYYSWLSEGRYDPDFIVGGTVPAGENCSSWATSHATGSSNAALIIRAGGGGYAGPGYVCPGYSASCPTTFPDNMRQGNIGVSSVPWSALAHEMGHMLSWPHSFTGASDSEYDNAIDSMSGNYGLWSSGGWTYWGTYPEPYATVAVNRYAAGWIDIGDVGVWDGKTVTLPICTVGAPGFQAYVIDDGSRYFVLGSRMSSTHDPFEAPWNGVEIYEVTRCDSCWGLNRPTRPMPPVPFVTSDVGAYSKPLPHVLGVGSSITIGDADITVVGRDDDIYTVVIAGEDPPDPDPPLAAATFSDVPATHTFFGDIEWLAAEGITRGCNPPSNSRYCPDSSVTRGQMAAFLNRAFGLASTPTDFFVDDDGSVFEGDINRLAAAGISLGCNPPANNRFCPDARLDRSQMAAFLVRALGLTDDGGGDLFTDDNGSVFEDDIDRLGTAGITMGCNPPANDRYCPDAPVSRAQMAAFLRRSIG